MNLMDLSGKPRDEAGQGSSRTAEGRRRNGPKIRDQIRFWSRSATHRWLSAMTVDRFRDDDGEEWASIEHFFQAAKPASEEDRLWIKQSPSPFVAKRRAWDIRARSDWKTIQVGAMRDAIRLRFRAGSAAAELLLSTGAQELLHETPWGRNGDTFWGTGRDGSGANTYGKLLMQRRTQLQGP